MLYLFIYTHFFFLNTLNSKGVKMGLRSKTRTAQLIVAISNKL